MDSIYFYLLVKSFLNFFFKKTKFLEWWAWLELNQRPIGYEPSALTPELQALLNGGRDGIRTHGTRKGSLP